MGREDYFDIQAVSNSLLGDLEPTQGGSPSKFYRSLSGDKEKIDSLSLERGSLLHDWMELPSSFIIADIDKPSGMMGTLVDIYYQELLDNGDPDPFEICQKNDLYKNIKTEVVLRKKFIEEGSDYLNFLIEASGKRVMTKATKYIVERCQDSLMNNPFAVKLMFGDYDLKVKEQIILWEEDGIACKAKLDIGIVDGDTVIIPDLKTTSKSAYNFKESFEFWHYYRQFEMYKRAFKIWLADQRIYPKKIKFFNIVVETNGAFNAVVQDYKGYTDLAKTELDRLLKQVKWHQETGIWSHTPEEWHKGYITNTYNED